MQPTKTTEGSPSWTGFRCAKSPFLPTTRCAEPSDETEDEVGVAIHVGADGAGRERAHRWWTIRGVGHGGDACELHQPDGHNVGPDGSGEQPCAGPTVALLEDHSFI